MRAYVLLATGFALSGCAASMTAFFERSTRTETVVHGTDKKYPALNPYVAGISVSSARRMIISARRSVTANTANDRRQSDAPEFYTCSEPPPDTGVSSDLRESLALSGGGPSANHTPALSAADSAALTAIVLSRRTELVELWRTTTYAVCLMRMNGESPKIVEDYLAEADKVLQHASTANEVLDKVQAGQAAQQTPVKDTSTTAIIAPANSVVVTVPTPPGKPVEPEKPAEPKE